MEILAKMANKGLDSEPEAQISSIGYLLLLDELEIYGTGIYILFKDKVMGVAGGSSCF